MNRGKNKQYYISLGEDCATNNNYAAIVFVNGSWQKKAFELGYGIEKHLMNLREQERKQGLIK